MKTISSHIRTLCVIFLFIIINYALYLVFTNSKQNLSIIEFETQAYCLKTIHKVEKNQTFPQCNLMLYRSNSKMYFVEYISNMDQNAVLVIQFGDIYICKYRYQNSKSCCIFSVPHFYIRFMHTCKSMYIKKKTINTPYYIFCHRFDWVNLILVF